jgi:DNA-binding transcriptional MerR regulator
MKDLSIKKLYYSISEVSKIVDVEQYVLRYWETEFEQLSPQKNRAGNRIYTNKEIQLILKIKNLLRDKKFTIEGAKKILENSLTHVDSDNIETNKITAPIESVENNSNTGDEIHDIKIDLAEIKVFLQSLLTKL